MSNERFKADPIMVWHCEKCGFVWPCEYGERRKYKKEGHANSWGPRCDNELIRKVSEYRTMQDGGNRYHKPVDGS